MERRAKVKSLSFGRGHKTVMELYYQIRAEAIAPDVVIRSTAQSDAKGTEEDTIDVDDYQLVVLNAEWKSGCLDKGETVKGFSEEDTDEGGDEDVQESRSLQSTPTLDTQSRDNHRWDQHRPSSDVNVERSGNHCKTDADNEEWIVPLPRESGNCVSNNIKPLLRL